jgi:alpha-tubulin suppressor-like RCC1 family protein
MQFYDTKNSTMKKIITILMTMCFLNIANAQCDYFTKLESGSTSNHLLAIRNDGRLLAWGNNDNAQIGDGTITNRLLPTLIGTAANWVSVATGLGHSLGITSDGKLWAWGDNTYAQLGDGTTTNRLVPTQIGTATNWVAIAAGARFSVAITSAGTLWAWGDNFYGQLGDGTTSAKVSPTQIGTLSDWIKISVGYGHVLAIKTDGSLWGWGNNSGGQVGVGYFGSNVSTPTQIGITTSWVSIAAGGSHSLAVHTNGSGWSWGSNTLGNLGDGTTTNRASPIQFWPSTGQKIISIAAGSANSYMLTITGTSPDGNIWSFGDGFALGINPPFSIIQKIPYPVNIINPAKLSAGAQNGYTIDANGKLYSWGDNNYGQHGNNSTTINFLPVTTLSPVFTGIAMSTSTSTMYQSDINCYKNACVQIANISQRLRTLNPITGNVTTSVWIDAVQPPFSLKRHFQITPALNPTTVSGRVTLFYTQQDFDDYNAVNSIKLPISPTDAAGKSHFYIEKISGTSIDGTGNPSSYPGPAITINPDDYDIVWDATLNRWGVTFDVTGFSGFFAKSSAATILPLRLTTFTGKKQNKFNQLEWKTAEEINTKEFELESSIDANNFTYVATINAIGSNGNNYSYNDNILSQSSTSIFYRLKIIDNDGRYSKSKTIKIDNRISASLVNTKIVDNILSININDNKLIHTKAILVSTDGKLIRSVELNNNQLFINVDFLATGFYFIQFENGVTQKIIKQ